jgi:hypothetical protein
LSKNSCWARKINESGKGARHFVITMIGQLSPNELKAGRRPINIRKGVMPTAVEQIHTKIAELEAKIADLRIAERELLAIEKSSARQARSAPEPKIKQKPGPKTKQKPGPKASLRPKVLGKPKANAPAEARQTIGSAITEVIDRHGALSAAEIAEHIKATGRDINNRTVSFALQALKKRGLAKNTDGKWSLPKARGRRPAAATEASNQLAQAAE